MLIEILTFSLICFLLIRFVKERSNSNYPAGPIGLPILGHLPFFGKNPALKLLKWKRNYGPIFSIRMGSLPAVVITDLKLVKEATGLQALSGRPMFPLLNEMTGRKGIVFSDGPSHSEQRKFVVDSFKEFGVGRSKLEFNIKEEIKRFQENLIETMGYEGWNRKFTVDHFFKLPTINSLWVVIGKRFDEKNTALNEITELCEKAFINNRTISNFIPLVAKFQNYFGVNDAVNFYRIAESQTVKLIEQQRKDYVLGKPKNFIHSYFDKVAETEDENSSFHISRREQITTTIDLLLAAVDTVTTTMDWFLLYMAREPEIQTKLQAEIDSVFPASSSGPESPSLSYRNQMPYTEAFIFELLRISSVAPFGNYHRALEEVEFHGYRIPKDTTIITNLYGIHHDPEVWEKPDEFKPERFLDEDGKLNKMSSKLAPFGFGKRACIGEDVARDHIFLFTTSFLQEFRIGCLGHLPSVDGIFGLVWRPKPFRVLITQRNVPWSLE